MKSVELLAPAKNLEIAIAAINSGADAIYIGAQNFGARKNAPNPLSDIEKLVNYAISLVPCKREREILTTSASNLKYRIKIIETVMKFDSTL